jgi:hypothetical protein
MKRSVSKRRARFPGFGAIALGLFCLVPAAAHAQATTATEPPPANKTSATTPGTTAPAGTSAETHPAPPPRPPAPALPATGPRSPAGPAQAAPTGYPPPPPRGYPPPPPRAYQNAQGYPPQNAWQSNANQGQAPYSYYYVPPDLRGAVYRPFSFSFSVGPGALIGPGEHELALTYNLFRLGFGIAPNLSLVIGFEGAGTNSVNPDSGEDSWLKQETILLGVQYHFGRGLYVRGSVGQGSISETTDYDHYSGGSGVAMSGAVGYEFVQTQHVALALDLNASSTRYARESWQTAGLNLALSFF